MTTKRLISNIEALSATLNQKQLIEFLDIMDELADMVSQAKKLSISLDSQLEQPAPRLH